jgi:hypothetical protein
MHIYSTQKIEEKIERVNKCCERTTKVLHREKINSGEFENK